MDTPPVEAAAGLHVVVVDQPVWYEPLLAPAWLVPAPADDVPKIAIVTLADRSDSGTVSDRPVTQVASDIGVLTRAIPVFLAHALRMTTTAQLVTYVPAVEGHGPIVTDDRWPVDTLLQMAKMELDPPMLVVSGALSWSTRHVKVDLQIWRDDGQLLSEVTASGHTQAIGKVVIDTFAGLKNELTEWTATRDRYRVALPPPPADQLGRHLSAVGSLLARRLPSLAATEDIILPDRLRELLRRFVEMAGDHSDPEAFVMFAALLRLCRQAAPAILDEYRHRTAELLQRRDWLPEIRGLLPFVLEASGLDGEDGVSIDEAEVARSAEANPLYAEWLNRFRA